MATLEDLERRIVTVERDHATARELALLRETVHGVISRLEVVETKLDGLVDDVAAFRAVQIEQSGMLRTLLDRGEPDR